MHRPGFDPREGGVKIVIDVEKGQVEPIAATITAAGFTVRRYDTAGDGHGAGHSAPGSVRLGAERPMAEFTDAEQASIVAAFDATRALAGFSCTVVGVDTWLAGDDGGSAGVREPRRPRPKSGSGAAEAARPVSERPIAARRPAPVVPQ